MKKDRNAFFSEASYFNQTNIPTPNQNITNMPFTTNAQSSFYAGPIAPMNYNINNNPNANMPLNIDYEDIISRLSKLERNYNRLDARISKLEANNIYTTDEIEGTTNMYMV